MLGPSSSSKKPVETNRYNLQYKRPTQHPAKKRPLFEEELTKGTKKPQSSFNLMDVMSTMKKSDPKRSDDSDARSREKAAKLKADKQRRERIEREMKTVMELEVKDKDGKQFAAVTTWTEGEEQVYKCWICAMVIPGGPVEVLGHLQTMRHNFTKKSFTEIRPEVRKPIPVRRREERNGDILPHARVRAGEPQWPRQQSMTPPAPPSDNGDGSLGDNGGLDDDHDDGGDVFDLPQPVPTSIPNPSIFSSGMAVGTNIPSDKVFVSNPWEKYDTPTAFGRSMTPPIIPRDNPSPLADIAEDQDDSPNGPPAPVPPPKPVQLPHSLTASDLEKLPSPLNLEERVARGLGHPPSRSPPKEDEAYEPGSVTPLWEPTPEEASIQLPKPKPKVKKTDGFNIDTTQSFMDKVELPKKPQGLKLKPMANLMDPKPAPKKEEPKKGLSGFLDKVINGLKKSTVNSDCAKAKLAALSHQQDTPLTEPLNDKLLEMNDMDQMVLQIVSGLDKDLTEEEKLVKAKEKLSMILKHKAEEQKEEQERQISDNEINNFMSQWCVDQKGPEDDNIMNPVVQARMDSQPAFSSALAKLRAKKQQRAGPRSQQLSLALSKLKKIHEPGANLETQQPLPPPLLTQPPPPKETPPLPQPPLYQPPPLTSKEPLPHHLPPPAVRETPLFLPPPTLNQPPPPLVARDTPPLPQPPFPPPVARDTPLLPAPSFPTPVAKDTPPSSLSSLLHQPPPPPPQAPLPVPPPVPPPPVPAPVPPPALPPLPPRESPPPMPSKRVPPPPPSQQELELSLPKMESWCKILDGKWSDRIRDLHSEIKVIL